MRLSSDMLILQVVFTLVCMHHTFAYQPPRLNCSEGVKPIGLEGLKDTLQKGDTLFYTESTLSILEKCESKSLLNVTESYNVTELNGGNGTAVVLNYPLSEYCEEQLSCDFLCEDVAYTPTMRTIGNIERTLPYNISFANDIYTTTVKENSESGTAVKLGNGLSLKFDNCQNGMFEGANSYYVLQKGPNDDNSVPFKWGAESQKNALEVSVSGKLDYETNQTYELVVLGYLDTSILNSTATATISVLVEDLDDNNPRFNISRPGEYQLKIPENNVSYVNTALLTSPGVFAYDPDYGLNESISYSIVELAEDGLFTIDNKSGAIQVTKPLDYEKENTYTIYIKAFQDDKPKTRTANTRIMVEVIDVDDHKPEFNGTYSCSVSEHAVQGTVVCSVRAVDKDGTQEYRKFEYFIWTNDGILSVDENGHITVNNSTMLDRETLDDNLLSFEVGTRTFDDKYGDNTTVTIKVIDINDNNPVFLEYNYTFILQNTTTVGTFVGQVNATDKDEGQNAKITYTILPLTSFVDCHDLPQTPLFSVNQSTGEILVAKEVSFCEKYVINVQACDNGISRRCKLTTVSIIYNSTNYAIYNQTMTVLEGLVNGTAVDIVKCGSKDRKYHKNGGSMFKIDSETGMVKTQAVFDRETQDNYSFRVNVTSTADMILCIVSIDVFVIDVNDNTPEFINEPYIFILPSLNPQTGALLGIIQANDSDIDENADVSYFIENDRSSSFMLEAHTGNLTINRSPLSNKDILQVYVTATDNGTPPRKQSTVVYVIGETDDHMVPISTPFTIEQIDQLKQDLTRNISRLINLEVEIGRVDKIEIQNKSLHKSRIHIQAVNKTLSHQYFLSQVDNHYEDIRSLFFRSIRYAGDQSSSKSSLGPSEIGLIVMAGVILFGAALAIVIVHRQFNSQKRYKQLYESLTKNSSLYESQEININIEDEVNEDVNGTVQSHEINENGPSLAASASNPAYQSDTMLTTTTDLNVTEEDNVSTEDNAATDVKEVLQRLSDSYEKEDSSEQATNPVDVDEEETSSQKVVYANLADENSNLDSANILTDGAGVSGETGPDSGNTKDLMSFDSDSNGEGTEQTNNETEEAVDEIAVEEEPKPDYNEKQVRFHSEVLDADENKLEPLKMKNEDAAECVQDESLDAEKQEENQIVDENTGDMTETIPSFEERNEAVGVDIESVVDDKDRLEEEIGSPNLDFYFGDMESTQF